MAIINDNNNNYYNNIIIIIIAVYYSKTVLMCNLRCFRCILKHAPAYFTFNLKIKFNFFN